MQLGMLTIENLLGVVAVIVVLALVIFIHEAGHMIAAKLARVEVTDFALGFGKSLVSREWRGTRYHLCLFPLGGYVKITVMDPNDPVTENSFKSKHPLVRFAILAGGALGNFVLAVILIFVLAFIGFPKSLVVVQGVVPVGPAAQAGVEPGDTIYSIGGRRITDSYALMRSVSSAARAGHPLDITFERRGEKYTRSIAPRSFNFEQDGKTVPYNSGKPSLGVINTQITMVTPAIDLVMPNSKGAEAGLKPGDTVTAINGEPITLGTDVWFYLARNEGKLEGPVSLIVQRGDETQLVTVPPDTTLNTLGVLFHTELERLPVAQTVERAVYSVYATTVAFVMQLRLLATKEGAEMVSGPVGIVNLIHQAARTGAYNLIMIAMVITLNLGLINLLPLPALDGGRIVFVLLGMAGLRISTAREELVHAIGFVVLISLILLITFRDIIGWVRLSG
jgi:regulator of sigma E protease